MKSRLGQLSTHTQGVNFWSFDGELSLRPLHRASVEGHVDIPQVLMEHDAAGRAPPTALGVLVVWSLACVSRPALV